MLIVASLQTCPCGACTDQSADRYFATGKHQGPEFSSLQPGKLSKETRSALRIGPLSPPPWLARMRELGIPPDYQGKQQPQPGAVISSGAHA